MLLLCFYLMTLKELLEDGVVSLARIPLKNDYLLGSEGALDLSKLDYLKAYTVPLIGHDYGAKTPTMWNSIYEKLRLPIRNIMVVGNPNQTGDILRALRADPRYLGGGAGVGFKESVIKHLDAVSPVDLNSVNIIVKEGNRLVGYNTDSRGLYLSVEEALGRVGKKTEGSNYVVLGAGGVAKDFIMLIARQGARRIGIINRTYRKAVFLANSINQERGDSVAYAAPEDLIRGSVLNTMVKVDAIVNCTDKGSDGPLKDISAFAPGSAGEFNNSLSIDVLRDLNKWNPEVVIVDIVLPKSGRSITLRHAESAGLENLVDGSGMVTNQAAPAYVLVQKAHPDIHTKIVTEQEALKIFKEAA